MRASGPLGISLAAALVAGWSGAAVLAAAPATGKPAAPAAPAGPAGTITPEQAEFFEKQVRPVLVESCYACHGPKLQQSGLRVDSLAALLRGSDGGHASVVPGDPDKSSLIQVLRYNGPVKMPPAGKLAPEKIAALEQWVKMGAPWPGGAAAAPVANAEDQAKKHWAFQPVRMPAIPKLKNTKSEVRNPIDAFVLKKLQSKGLTMSPEADRRTLIRRATFDLLGLPPTPAQMEEFLKDRSPDAYEKLIDRLLTSPHYGERWGRYWLDVARYADTKGYVFTDDRNYPYAYTYRDWVVQSLNDDLPYDQFLVRQIAADRLPMGDDKRSLAAMGFLTVGRRFLNNTHDIIDDRMDVLMRGTQGMTVGCARCHDHKFDPIPIKDYYSLYGVFASSDEPREGPMIGTPEANTAFANFERELNSRQAKVNEFQNQKRNEILAKATSKIADSLLAAREAAMPGANLQQIAQKRDLPPALVRRWMNYMAETRRTHHPVLTPWHKLAALADAEFAAKAPALAAAFAANKYETGALNPTIAAAFAGNPPASVTEVAERMAKVLQNPSRADQQLLHALDSIGGPLNIPPGEAPQYFSQEDRSQLQALQKDVDTFRATSPAAPPRAMVLVDRQNPFNPQVFRRGNPNNRGEQVPRQFLAVLSGPDRKPFNQGSGRLELAQAIASKSNPLTARVMANRVWLWHFGSALVDTPSDFGLRSGTPSNPELLDFMAARFMEDGWSIKKLHKLIMTSATYRQSSIPSTRTAGANPRLVDPENRLYWRMNRRRLDFEGMRDTMLAVTGQLDESVGGKAVDILNQPFATRRTLYGFIDRQNLPGLFRVFDFASPDSHSPGRFVTTVPQQALFLMNSPFVVESARKWVEHPAVKSETTATGKLNALYQLAYGRPATPEETTMALRFLKNAQTEAAPAASAGAPAVTPVANGTPAAKSQPKLEPWQKLAQVLLISDEFFFID